MSKQTEILAERLTAWRKANPLPAPTGQVADKAFFDGLCGEEEHEAIDRGPEIAPPQAPKDT